LLRCRLVAPATVPTNKPDPQFLIIVCHHKVSTYFGGHLMHQSTQKQKVQGNSRLRSDYSRLSHAKPRSKQASKLRLLRGWQPCANRWSQLAPLCRMAAVPDFHPVFLPPAAVRPIAVLGKETLKVHAAGCPE
ncbi:hypothetical protein, partial [Bradyrhizobium sp. CW4]|uniref:hypothetical protein n=1 Tax=Bradyrhizobium sp. CW4 TaxID=2782687 RepID=UPI0031FC6DFF